MNKIKEAVSKSIDDICTINDKRMDWDKVIFKKAQFHKRVDLLKNILLDVNLSREDIILEIGPAEGIIARALHYLGYNVEVLEHSSLGEAIPLDDYYKPLKVKTCKLEDGNFPYDDESFTFIYSIGVIEHQEPPTINFW